MSPPTEAKSTISSESRGVLEARLIRTLGPIVGGSALSRALGYPSQGAFRKALVRGRLPVRVFELDGRRGRFAFTSDIAEWLWSQRNAGLSRERPGQAEVRSIRQARADRPSRTRPSRK